eukprot:TRINITY_DN42629_c0_g1_i1.p2 TRINITY_DN42629_c0_g1~~TRINITY_DN42629_c0_g1_i1.p2  ORF type:complete len:254 (+),score=79.54 TRINITY_DN42629_c0_g1_i1:101-862(+)
MPLALDFNFWQEVCRKEDARLDDQEQAALGIEVAGAATQPQRSQFSSSNVQAVLDQYLVSSDTAAGQACALQEQLRQLETARQIQEVRALRQARQAKHAQLAKQRRQQLEAAATAAMAQVVKPQVATRRSNAHGPASEAWSRRGDDVVRPTATSQAWFGHDNVLGQSGAQPGGLLQPGTSKKLHDLGSSMVAAGTSLAPRIAAREAARQEAAIAAASGNLSGLRTEAARRRMEQMSSRDVFGGSGVSGALAAR